MKLYLEIELIDESEGILVDTMFSVVMGSS